jgi:hypothetical protein
MTEFLNAQLQSKKHPDTFRVPNQYDLDLISKNDYVKICDNNERFWVQITNVDKEKLTGRVDNDLVNEHSFKCDDIIDFEKRNVMTTL